MLAPSYIKFLALAGLALLLAGPSAGFNLKGHDWSKEQQDKTSTTSKPESGDNKSHDDGADKIPALPDIDDRFKALLDSILEDKELSRDLAQYVEVAPSSHKSRALIGGLGQVSSQTPKNNTNGNGKGNSTDSWKPGPTHRPNPLKEVIEMILEQSRCEQEEQCSNLVCLYLKQNWKIPASAKKGTTSRRHRSEIATSGRHQHGECEPCPVPNYCNLPDLCKKTCPAKPKCPCGEEPQGIWVAEEGGGGTSKKPKLPRASDGDGDHSDRQDKQTRGSTSTTKKPPCWAPGGSANCTSTTTTTNGIGSSTSKRASVGPSSPSTTKRVKPSAGASTSTTKRTKPSASSSTTKKATGSSSTTTSTGKPPRTTKKVKPSTTAKARPTGSTTKRSRHIIKETNKDGKDHTKIVEIDGKKTEIKGRNVTTNYVEYLQLEDGLKVLLKNKTVVKFITNAINAQPQRSGGMEGRLAGRVLNGLGLDTDTWLVPASSKHDRSMTYSTITNNQIVMLKALISMLIKRRCKHCVKACEDKSMGLPEDELVCKEPTGKPSAAPTSSPASTTAKPKSGSSMRACQPCWTYERCPARPGCMTWKCHSPFSFHCNKTTLKPNGGSSTVSPSTAPDPSKNSSSTTKPSGSSTPKPSGPPGSSAKPAGSTTSTKPGGSTTSTKPGGSTTSAKPGGSTTSAKPGESTTSAKPGGSTTSAKPGESTTSAKPGGSTTSAKPPNSMVKQSPGASTTPKSSGGSSTTPKSGKASTTTAGSSSTSRAPSGASSSPKPSMGPSSKASATPKANQRLDPDFAPDDESAPRMGQESENRADNHELDDMDSENQISDEERFKEVACNGSICADQKSCGAADLNELTPKKKQSGYIVNGEKQKYGEWPSYAKLEIMLNPQDKSLCGGVLISKRHVLTAGHCVREPRKDLEAPDKGYKLKPSQVSVIMGEHERGKKDKFEARYKVAKICYSSKFNDPNGEGSRFDFAVLTLKNEVKLNDHVQPACLPYKPFPIGKAKCFVVGQGKTREPDTDYLVTSQFVQKMPVGRRKCHDWGFNEHDRSRWCFTKSKGQGDSCNGDSGGPILCRSKDNKWHVMGLVSYGSEMCDGAESSGWVAVYTRVPGLLEQIHLDCLNKDAQ